MLGPEALIYLKFRPIPTFQAHFFVEPYIKLPYHSHIKKIYLFTKPNLISDL